MNIIDALTIHAEQRAKENSTVYFLSGRIIYPDEIFSSVGFMPLIARVAQKSARRLLGADQLSECGFSYSPYKESLLCEKINVMDSDAGVLPDNMRLLLLRNASTSLVGMEYMGALDLTPIHQMFMEISPDERSSMVEQLDETHWPLFKPMRVN